MGRVGGAVVAESDLDNQRGSVILINMYLILFVI